MTKFPLPDLILVNPDTAPNILSLETIMRQVGSKPVGSGDIDEGSDRSISHM